MRRVRMSAELPPGTRVDHRIIYDVVDQGSRVLDLGCGEGDLLSLLVRYKDVKGQGIELDDTAVRECVRKGVNAFQSDIETGLEEYPDHSFDYVILNQSMQQVRRVDFLVEEALRVGDTLIVGFPNFAHWSARCMLFFKGRAPITDSLPYRWSDTPNVRFLSTKDFTDFCRIKNIRIHKTIYLGRRRRIRWFPNLFAVNAIFVVSRSPSPSDKADRSTATGREEIRPS